MQENAPQPGYYKYQFKGDIWRGICFYVHSERGLQCVTRGDDGKLKGVDTDEAMRVWTWCAKRPTTKALCYEWLQTGNWRDLDATPSRSNMPSDPFEALKIELADKKENADRLLKQHKACPDKETADKAANIAAELRALITRADKLHKTEKDYWLQGGRGVDGKFKFRAEVQEKTIASLTAFHTKWQIEETKREKVCVDAENAIIAAAAEAARQADIEKAEKLAEQFPGVDVAAFDEPAPAPKFIAPQRVQVGGGVGPKAGLRKEYKAERINIAAAMQHYSNHPHIVAAIEAAMDELANSTAKRDKEKAFVYGYRIVNELGEVLSDGIDPKKEAA